MRQSLCSSNKELAANYPLLASLSALSPDQSNCVKDQNGLAELAIQPPPRHCNGYIQCKM
jgi:hypothetical protein